MAEKTPPKKEPQPAADNAAPASPPSSSFGKVLLAKLLVLLFVVGVVVTECLIAYFCFPSAAQTAEMVGATVAEPQGESPAKSHRKGSKDKKDGKETADQVEVDLGEYSLTAAHPTANTTLQISFHLYGTVAAADEQEFLELKKENEHRFREQVLVTVRSANLADLTDAGLGLLKRNILEKTNRILGRPMLQMIIFSDFAFIEQ